MYRIKSNLGIKKNNRNTKNNQESIYLFTKNIHWK